MLMSIYFICDFMFLKFFPFEELSEAKEQPTMLRTLIIPIYIKLILYGKVC